MDREQFKSIQDGQLPFIIKNSIETWPLFNYDCEAWCTLFNGKMLTFRKGFSFSKVAQWEGTCSKVDLALNEFFNLSKDMMSDHFLYYDYKHISEIFPGRETVFDEINWSNVGFSGATGKESTLWIGNKGAHTPCHMDSYGFNLVAQLYGRKLWLLMPPEETKHLKPTRVPYEESSVYSDLNFHYPSSDFYKIGKIYQVILEKGDVLCVPRHWWHYVENLDTAISINTWIPVEEDEESRLEEALVQRIVVAFCQDLTVEEAKQILNPNETTLLHKVPDNDIVEITTNKCNVFRKSKRTKTRYFDNLKCENVTGLKAMTKKEVEALVQSRSRINSSSSGTPSIEGAGIDRLATYKSLINAICHPEVICLVKEKLLQSS